MSQYELQLTTNKDDTQLLLAHILEQLRQSLSLHKKAPKANNLLTLKSEFL